MMPFRGRLIYCHYIPRKRHRYRIKLFKICNPKGYTYRLSVYKVNKIQRIQPKKENCQQQLFLILLKNFCIKEERSLSFLYIFATSPQAVGSRHTPIRYFEEKPKDDIVVAKWQNKRDVLFLTTKHNLEMKTAIKNEIK